MGKEGREGELVKDGRRNAENNSKKGRKGSRRTVGISEMAMILERTEHYYRKYWWDAARAQGHVSI